MKLPPPISSNPLITACRACGGRPAKTARACPHCGHKPPRRTSPLSLIVAIVIGLVIGGMVSGAIVNYALAEARRSQDSLRAANELAADAQHWNRLAYGIR